MPGVLSGDSDVDGDPLTAAVVTNPAHGTLSLNSDGSFTYTPTPGYSGDDSFVYGASDGAIQSYATVSITVAHVNHVPGAGGDAYSTDEDTPLVIPATGVLGNDSDLDSDSLTAVLVSGPAHGTVSLSADGSFTYTPHANFSGPDSFTYSAFDGLAASAATTVSLTVNAINDAPVPVNDTYSTGQDQTLTVSAAGVFTNDTDVDGDALTATVTSPPSHGSLSLNSNGGFAYTPTSGYYGIDTFTYSLSDGTATAEGTVTVQVNGWPLAQTDAYVTNEDTPLVVAAVDGVLANDNDPEADPLTASVVTAPAHGSLTLGASGSFTYSPTIGYYGNDAFSYRLWDGHSYSAPVTVTLTVTPIPRITIDILNGAVESGASGLFRLRRTGDTSQEMTVEFLVVAEFDGGAWR